MELTPKKKLLKKGRWFPVPDRALSFHSKKLGRPHLLAIYCVLWSHTNESLICWPSQKRIEAMSGVKLRSVVKAIKELARIGAIEVQRRYRNGKTRNTYRLVDPVEWSKQSAQYALRSMHCMHPNKTHRNNKERGRIEEMRKGLVARMRIPAHNRDP